MTKKNTPTGAASAAPVRKPCLLVRSAAAMIADETIAPRTPIFGDWLLERGNALLYAPSGIGKSLLALSIAAAVAGGGGLHTWKAPEARPVLLVDGEMDPSDLKERLTMLTAAVSGDVQKARENLHVFARMAQPVGKTAIDLAQKAGQDAVRAMVAHIKPALVVLDNLSTLATIADENRAEAWGPLLAFLKELNSRGASVLVVHHSRKGGVGTGAYRGSQKLSVEFETITELARAKDASNGAAFTWRWEKGRRRIDGYGEEFAFALVSDESGTRWDTGEPEDRKLHEMVSKLKSGEFATQNDIATAFGMSAAWVTGMKTKAIDRGLVKNANEWLALLHAGKRSKERAAAEGQQATGEEAF
jgi:RecA-family ATPase